MVAQEGLRLFSHSIQIEIQGTALPAEVPQQGNRTRIDGILVIPTQGVVAGMEIGCTRLQIANTDEPLSKPVNGANHLCSVYLSIIIKMHALPTGMHTRIGTTGTGNTHRHTQCYRKSIFESRLNRDELGLSALILGLPAIKSRPQVFAAETITH